MRHTLYAKSRGVTPMENHYFLPWKDVPIDEQPIIFAVFDKGKIRAMASIFPPENPSALGLINGFASGEPGRGSELFCCLIQKLPYPFKVEPSTDATEWWKKRAREFNAREIVLHGEVYGYEFRSHLSK